MDFEFDRGIAVRGRRHRGSTPPTLDRGWVVGGGLNGGYLLAVIGNAIRAELADVGPARPDQRERLLPHARPRPAPPSCGCGGSASVGSAPRSRPAWSSSRTAPRSSGSPCSASSARWTGCRPRSSARSRRPTCLPSRTASRRGSRPRRCAGSRPCWSGSAPASTRRTSAGRSGKPSGTGLIQGWFKLADDRPLDPIALLLVVDALPPVTFDLGLPGLGPDPRADRARARQPGARLGDRAARDPEHLRRPVRGGLRGLGLRRAGWSPSRASWRCYHATGLNRTNGRSGLDGLHPFCGSCGFRLVSGPDGG